LPRSDDGSPSRHRGIRGSNLEVGDPLTGAVAAIALGNGFTNHLQDLAFLSWFDRQSPSIGFDGSYSLLSTFTTSAGAICH
jgi:hypothetical protein